MIVLFAFVVTLMASNLVAIALRVRVVHRLKAIGRYEEFGSPPAYWTQPNLLPLQLVLRLRGRVGASDWRLFVTYLVATVTTIVSFMAVIGLAKWPYWET